MEIQEMLAKVEQSTTFREWKSGTPQAFLSSMFVLVDGGKRDWQVAFHDPQTQHTAAFLIGEVITLIPPEPTFKEPGTAVHALDISRVTFDLPECLALVAERQQRDFPMALPSKIIAILQHLPIGVVYNVTYVTVMLSTLNFKVDVTAKEIREAKLIPIISFAK